MRLKSNCPFVCAQLSHPCQSINQDSFHSFLLKTRIEIEIDCLYLRLFCLSHIMSVFLSSVDLIARSAGPGQCPTRLPSRARQRVRGEREGHPFSVASRAEMHSGVRGLFQISVVRLANFRIPTRGNMPRPCATFKWKISGAVT